MRAIATGFNLSQRSHQVTKKYKIGIEQQQVIWETNDKDLFNQQKTLSSVVTKP